jgi:hypothetical protein
MPSLSHKMPSYTRMPPRRTTRRKKLRGAGLSMSRFQRAPRAPHEVLIEALLRMESPGTEEQRQEVWRLFETTNLSDIADEIYNGYTLPMAAVEAEQDDILSLLLEISDVNKQGYDGLTPLHIAAGNGRSTALDILLEWGADTEIADSRGETPLWVAVRRNRVDCVTDLLERGADPNHANKAGKSMYDFIGTQDDETDPLSEIHQMNIMWIKDALCNAGCAHDDCIRRAHIGEVSLPRNMVVNEKTQKREPIKNAITFEPIQNRNEMVTFHNEMSVPRYYTRNTWKSLKGRIPIHEKRLIGRLFIRRAFALSAEFMITP